MTRGAAFDIQAVCTGFVYALAVGGQFHQGGQAKTVLVIGAETMTRLLDWNDRATCILFGDGAGAVVLQAGEGEGERAIAACWARSSIPTDGCTIFSMSTADLRRRRRRACCACRDAKSSSMRW